MTRSAFCFCASEIPRLSASAFSGFGDLTVGKRPSNWSCSGTTEKFGLRCVDTLTGFKYNGAKLKKYEELTRARNYRELSEEETRRLRLEKSSFYIFGGEESYGYSAADFVRDKDGNAAVIMFCEVAAYAKSRGLTLDELLDKVCCEFGYFEEKNQSVYFEGADGAGKIHRLLISYDENPPRQQLTS